MKQSFILAENSPFGRAGEKVTLDLAPGDVSETEELSTYLAGYKPFGYRADEASPVILVDRDSDQYRSFTSANTFRRVDVKTSIQAKVGEVDPQTELSTYKVVDRAIGSFVPDVVEQNATKAYRPRQAALKRCQRVIMLDRELDVWALLTATANWTTGYHATLGATQKWNGGSASDPIRDIQERMEASAQEITDCWMSQRTCNAFLRHPTVRDHMRQMIGDNAPNAAIAQVNQTGGGAKRDFQIPGLPPIRVVGGKVENASTGVLDYIIGNDVVLTTRPPGVPTDGEEIATTYTFRRRGPGNVGFETRQFRVEDRGPRGGQFIVCAMADDEVMTGPNCGGLIKDAWQ